jgi:hypothetical protein
MLGAMSRLTAAASGIVLRAMMKVAVAVAERGLRRAFARRANRTT